MEKIGNSLHDPLRNLLGYLLINSLGTLLRNSLWRSWGASSIYALQDSVRIQLGRSLRTGSFEWKK